MNKIEVKNLHKAFDKNKVLNGVDISVKEGESLVIIGGSGTGKSVLLKSILGLIDPDNGQILINGKDTAHLNIRKREKLMHSFGMLFQGGALFDSLSIWENITFAVRKNISSKQAFDLAIEKLELVGLKSDIVKLYPSELSGGMQKRVALARAITGDPEIIFFDEPTTGLDPIMADVINDLIVKCTRDLGITTVSITHDMASAYKIATNIAMIYKGKIIWQGSVNEVKNSGNEYVDQFINGRADGPIRF